MLHATYMLHATCTAPCLACQNFPASASFYRTKLTRHLALSTLCNSTYNFLIQWSLHRMPSAAFDIWESITFHFSDPNKLFRVKALDKKSNVGLKLLTIFPVVWALGDLIVPRRTGGCRKSSFSQEGVHAGHFGIADGLSWSLKL